MRLCLAALGLLAASCDAPGKPVPVGSSACRSVAFEGESFVDCLADPQRHQLRLVIDPNVRDLDSLARSLGAGAAKVRFAMNGGMYDDKGGPIGLAVVAGKQLHPLNRKPGQGNFHLLPNGVFSAEPDGWRVRTSDAYAAASPRSAMATQSGPMLVIDGKLHPKIAPDGSSLYIRNAVGIDRAGKAHFVISDRPVSFGKLARLLQDKLDCPNALFLDGAVSALWDPASQRIDRTVPLGPLLVVETK